MAIGPPAKGEVTQGSSQGNPPTLVISGVGGFFCLFFPYVFPLQVQNLLHKVLHAGGAILLHALGEVTVFVQSEGGGGVAHVGLHGFYIVPGPDRVHGISVAAVC